MTQTTEEIVAPQSLEAEMATLGSIFLKPEVLDEIILTLPNADLFYRTKHRTIYESIIRVWKAGAEIDWVTVKEDLDKAGQLDRAGGVAYLQEVTEATPSSLGASQYALVVRDKAMLRWMIAACGSVQGKARGAMADPTELMGEMELALMGMMEATYQHKALSVAEVLDDVFSQIELYQKVVSGEDATLPGVPSYIKDLDLLLTGFKPGEFLILAARPGHGKTSLALNIATQVAVSANITKKHGGVVFFSLEMSVDELLMRSVCSRSEVDLMDVRTKILTGTQERDLERARASLSESALFLDDDPSLTLAGIRAKSRMLKRREGIGLIIVDYLQLMNGDRRLDRYEQIGMMSRGLKQLARELKIPILALAQLNRKIEQRSSANPRPMLSDLRESGNQEQDADVVMFLQRENLVPGSSHYNRWTAAEKEPATLIVAKNRKGPIGDVPLVFEKSTTTFKAGSTDLTMLEMEYKDSSQKAWDEEDK